MTTGKRIAFLLSIVLIGMNLNAQENRFTFRPFYGGGGGTAVFDCLGGYGIGGIGEFALLLYDKGLQMGLSFMGRGDGITTVNGNNYGAGSILGKISLGGIFPNSIFRGYSFIEGGIGFGGGNGTTAINVIFGGGGGIDLFFHQKGSIYLELGYLQHILNNELIGGISVSLGTRGFFKI